MDTTFKVGDRIRLINGISESFRGIEGVIVQSRYYGTTYYKIHFPIKGNVQKLGIDTFFINESHIEKKINKSIYCYCV